MRQDRALIVGIPLFILALSYEPAEAQKKWADLQPGDVIEFLLPAEEPPSLLETVFISGGQLLTIDTTGCTSPEQHPVQHYTSVDPTGARSSRSAGIIPLTTDPIRPGTRLGSLTPGGTCLIGTVLYTRYAAAVQ